MANTINTNLNALGSYRQLGTNNKQVNKSLQKLASGLKINSAKDDAAGLAISEKMMAQLRGLSTASSNALDGISLVQTAEGGLGQVHDMLGRMSELAGRAANGTLSDSDRQMIQSEANALKDEINRISESTNFNGINLLDGSQAGGLDLQVGDTADSYNQVNVSIGNMSTQGLGIDDIDLSTAEGASAALEKLRSASGAINQVSGTRGELGALQNRLEHTINNLDVTYENMAAANSRIRDTDMAKQMMEYTKMSILSKASNSMMSHSLQANSVLQLLR